MDFKQRIVYYILKYCKRLSLIIVLSTISIIGLSQEFQRVNDIEFKSGSLGMVTWCDYNSDGHLDIFITGSNPYVGYPYPKLYKNNGNSTFSDIDLSYMPKVIYGDVSWGDFDNNGSLDLIIAGTTSGFPEHNTTRIYKNIGDTSFIEIPHHLPSLYRCNLEWVDINGNGKLDIFYHGINSSAEFDLGIFENKGSDTFEQVSTNIDKIIGPTGNYSTNTSKWVDLDKDGLKDAIIAMATKDDFKLQCYKNNGDFEFSKVDLNLPDLNYVTITTGDINQDGLIDIILAGSSKQRLSAGDIEADIYMLINKGHMQFEKHVIIENIGVFYNSLELADIDNDGYLDFLLYGTGGSFRRFLLYKNNRNLTFSPIDHSLPDCCVGGATFGDFDNDNDLDFLYYGDMRIPPYGLYTTHLYENISTIPNNNPSPPNKINAFVIGKDVDIRWNNGSDDATSPLSLYTNLSIGSYLNPQSLLSSNSLDEHLKTIDLGNLNLNRNYYYKDFPMGQFQISVQSIDNSFNASVLSSIQFCYKPSLNIFNDTLSYCKGDSILIGVNDHYKAYTWNTGSHDSAIYVKSPGWYNLNIKHDDDCTSSEQVFLKEKTRPNLYLGQNDTILKSESITIEPNQIFNSYLWNDGSTNNKRIVYGEEESLGNHLFWLKVSNENNCSNSDSIFIFIKEDPPVAENWFLNSYPNPFTNQITISSNYIISGETEIKIIDMIGKLVYHKTTLQLDYLQTIDAKGISNGSYFLIISNKSNNIKKTFKLVKHHTVITYPLQW